MDIKNYHVGYVSWSPRNKSFFTVVDEHGDVHVYERPYGASTREIRIAVAVAFIDEQDYALDYRVSGRYPNYVITEVE